jgi:hypothetical protein
MDARNEAEQNIIDAADRWAREILRGDKLLDDVERNLFDAVMRYTKLLKDPSHLPPPPLIPRELEDQIPTERYSDKPTVPSPPRGIRKVSEDSDPDSDDIF